MTSLNAADKLDPQYWSRIRAQPLDEPGFVRMFGAASLRLSPSFYHLMLLGHEGGLDIHFSFNDMLDRARLVSRHEEAFGWSSISSDGASIHCALLDCLVRECAAQRGLWPAIEIATQATQLPSTPGSGMFVAFSVAREGPDGQATLAAVEKLLPSIMPGARVSRIEPQLSIALARALPGAQRDERARLLAAASEAISIEEHALHALHAPPSSACRL